MLRHEAHQFLVYSQYVIVFPNLLPIFPILNTIKLRIYTQIVIPTKVGMILDSRFHGNGAEQISKNLVPYTNDKRYIMCVTSVTDEINNDYNSLPTYIIFIKIRNLAIYFIININYLYCCSLSNRKMLYKVSGNPLSYIPETT